ncbi:MAG: serine hydrolase domain-containing protein, partial [Gammaproteobacteria bacterium]
LILAAVLLSLVNPVFARELPDTELTQYIERGVESGEYVGMIVGYIDGADTYVQAFGHTSRDGDQRPNENTVFEISSIAKTFTVTLLAESVIDGDMALTDAVNDHLESGVSLADFEGHEVTMLDLASHQSGLPYMPTDLVPDDGPNPYAATTTSDLIHSINAFVPESPAGQGYSYSAFAYGTIAHTLSIKQDATFEELVERRITKPLGMHDTVMQLNTDQSLRLATGYTPEGTVATPLEHGVFSAAGSMYSTLHDLMIWLNANLGRIDSPLNDAIEMTHPLRNDLGTIGLAWHQTEGHNDRSQFGTAHGYRAYVGFLADGSKGVVVLANTKANVMDIGERLLLASDLPPAED